jgi:prepilin-type N-terminal cleavage/methylation domain-containing protein
MVFSKLNEKREGFTLIELLIVVAIIGILAAIAIPQYARYRKGAQDNAAQSAYHAIALSEEAYFAQKDKYATNLDTLVLEAGLVRDPHVAYGTISTYINATTSIPGFAFTVNHNALGSTIYRYRSADSITVTNIGVTS